MTSYACGASGFNCYSGGWKTGRTVTLHERSVTARIVGQQEECLAGISAYLRILDKIRLAEVERDSGKMEAADGQLR